MLTLTEFLLARIAEDEAAAREATPFGEARTFYSSFGAGSDDWGCYYFNVPPARVMAECEAKRRIVERYDQTLYMAATIIDESGEGWEHLTDNAAFLSRDQFREHQWTLRALATPYADHPDYREEWKP